MFRRILFTMLAVVLAAAGTAAVALYARGADARALRGQQSVEVYVAKTAVPEGTTLAYALSDGLLRRERLASKAVPAGALRTVTAAQRDKVALSGIPEGSLVMEATFGAKSASAVVAIPRGKVAVAIELSDPARIAGLLMPGSEVAVFDTFTIAPGNIPSGEGLGADPQDIHRTRLMIARATVLAIGEAAYKQGASSVTKVAASKSKSEVAAVVTLAVTQVEAERLITVAQTGKPWFALLDGDSKVKPGPGTDTRQLFSNGATP